MVRQLVFVVVMAFIVLLGGMGAISAAYGEGGQLTEIEDEEFEPVGGETIILDNSNIDDADYSETVTVIDNQDNQFVAGEDYYWHSSNGTITVIENSSLSEENSAFITYNFTVPTDEANTFIGMVDSLTLGLVGVVFGVSFLVLLQAARMIGGNF